MKNVWVKKGIFILTGILLVLLLYGCGQKYRIIYEGDGFTSKKTEYAAGEKVSVYYGLIGTDTDYQFWSDEVKLRQDYDYNQGYVLRFTMPASDVTIHMATYSTIPPESLDEEGMQGESEDMQGEEAAQDESEEIRDEEDRQGGAEDMQDEETKGGQSH